MVQLLLSCSKVEIKDEIFYGNKGMMGAVEFHTFVPGQREIPFEEWMKILRTKPLICSSIDTFGDIKVAIEQLCSICDCCTADITKKAEEFFKNIDLAKSKMKKEK